jgi:hypothetical protein
MGKFFGSASGWFIILLVALVALVSGIAFGWFDSGGSPGPGPSGTAAPTLTPTPSTTATPTSFVDRPVTKGPHVPSASALTADVLAAAGSGWVVAIDDTSQVNTANNPYTVTSDQKILYLISPDGTRYELANLDGIGLNKPDLVAWDYARDVLLMEQAGTTLNVFDMASGAVTSSWTFCPGGYGSARYGEARGGNWVVRAGCEGTGVDALYTDAGVVVPSTIQVAPPMVTNFDIGIMQVRYEFEGTVDKKYLAYSPDGASEPLPWSALSYCDTPLGKGRGDTLAVLCYSDAGKISIEELPVDGTPPHEVVSTAQLDGFAMAHGGFGPGEYGLTGYWSDSARGIVQFWFGDANSRLGVLNGGTVEAVGADASYPFRRVHAVSGTSALVSGGGGLWWVNFDGAAPVVLLPPAGSGTPVQTVGTDGYMIGMDDGYTALRQP